MSQFTRCHCHDQSQSEIDQRRFYWRVKITKTFLQYTARAGLRLLQICSFYNVANWKKLLPTISLFLHFTSLPHTPHTITGNPISRNFLKQRSNRFQLFVGSKNFFFFEKKQPEAFFQPSTFTVLSIIIVVNMNKTNNRRPFYFQPQKVNLIFPQFNNSSQVFFSFQARQTIDSK